MIDVKKPVIPAEVAELLDKMLKASYSNEEILVCASYQGRIGAYREILSQIPFDTLLAALVNGYEREMTEEERAYAAIREEYMLPSETEWAEGYDEGIEFALNKLGIKIEGVNA